MKFKRLVDADTTIEKHLTSPLRLRRAPKSMVLSDRGVGTGMRVCHNRKCGKKVWLDPASSKQALGIRCEQCLHVFCRSCAQRHFGSTVEEEIARLKLMSDGVKYAREHQKKR